MKLNPIFLTVLIIAASCSSDKQAQLNKLKQQQSAIAEKIKSLESDSTLGDDPSPAAKSTLVVTQAIEPTTFRHYIEVQARLDGDENVGVSPQAPGKIIRLPVSVGQIVKKGQLLATLDDDVLEKQLQQMETNLDFLTDVYNKQKRLWDQNIGSQVQYLSAKNNKESMEAQIAAMKKQIANMHITSPIDGAIEDISVKEGQFVSPGLPVIRVVNFNRLKVVADLSEAYSDKINVGDAVRIYFPDLNKEAEAKVSFSSRYINPVNRSFTVEAHLTKPIPGLKVNMVAVMRINDYTATDAIAIPVNLIQSDRDQNVVYIAENNPGNKAQRVVVEQGASYNGVVEIKSGLKPGDKLITVGYQGLADGQAIRVK